MCSRSVAGLAALAVVAVLVQAPATAGATAHSGAPGRSGEAVSYAPPVQRPVQDPFRMDAGHYGPGNRGLEYATVAGDLVRAVAAGVVAFAGPVAGRRVISIEHPDGRRSTLTGLDETHVRAGELVARGTPVGTAAPALHLGVIEAGRYIDPARLFGGLRRRAVLVPAVSAPGGQGSTVSARSVARAAVALHLQPSNLGIRHVVGATNTSIAREHPRSPTLVGVVAGSRRTEGKEPDP